MINLKVVSPQKVIFEKEVEMAVLPGAEGDFAAMENHSPFISSLRPGQMAIMANNQLQESFFVSGGLVMLKDKTCEVLVDQIESLGDVNSSNYQQTIYCRSFLHQSIQTNFETTYYRFADLYRE